MSMLRKAIMQASTSLKWFFCLNKYIVKVVLPSQQINRSGGASISPRTSLRWCFHLNRYCSRRSWRRPLTQHACAQLAPDLRGPRTGPPVDFTTCSFGLPTAGRRSSLSTWSSRPSVPAGATPRDARWACRPPCSIQCRVFIDCVHPHLTPQCDNTSKGSHFALLLNLLHAVIVPACPNIHRAKPRATANESTVRLSSYEESQFWNA
jgi:hypothetical protein